jgi:hypothetical protein
LFCSVASADLQSSFTGSRFEGLTNTNTIFESYGVVDGTNNMIDFSGSNLVTYSEVFGNWLTVRSTVTTDQAVAPDGTVSVDIVSEDGSAANTHYVLSANIAVTAGNTYTASIFTRSINREWFRMQIFQAGLDANVFYNAETGIVGTQTGNIDAYVINYNATNDTVGPSQAYKRFCMTWIAPASENVTLGIFVAEADNDINFDGQSQQSLYVWGAQVSLNDEYRTGPGVYHRTVATVTKPIHDLAPANAPTEAKAHLQGQSGNKLDARAGDGVNQHYSKAHHNSMNVFDGDFTITFVAMQDSGAGNDYIFEHGALNTDGIDIQVDGCSAADPYTVRLHNGGDSTSINTAAGVTCDEYHVVQIVRNSNTVTAYLDGTAGTPVDATGYGIDGSQTWYILSQGADYWEGALSYFRVDAAALLSNQLNYERDILLGVATGTGNAVPNWTSIRDSIAMKEFPAGGADALVSQLSVVPIDHVRVSGSGGGVLIEGESENIALYSQQFNDATWQKSDVTVTANSAVAPDGTTTVDTLRENGVAATEHFVYQENIAVTNGEYYTASIYADDINRDWIYLTASNDGAEAYFNVAEGRVGTLGGGATARIEALNGYYRCSMTYQAGFTGNEDLVVAIAEADNDITFDGATQDSLYVWQAQFENHPFPTSSIATVATSQTRQAEYLAIDPHTTGTTNFYIPETYCATCTANRLSIYLEAKCEWSANANMIISHQIFEISGNTGTASETRNRLGVFGFSDGRIYTIMRDDDDDDHTGFTAVDVADYSEWFSVRYVLDFTDLSRMTMWFNEDSSAISYAGRSGADTFDTTGTMIRIGQDYDEEINGFCRVRNLRVNNREVRP